MTAAEDSRGRLKLGPWPFILAGASFIPLLGVLFGIAALIWAAATRKQGRKKLALVATCGIAFTFLIYGSLFYFGLVQRGGMYDHLRAQLAQNLLNQLVPTIELYKLQHGEYPVSLKQLRESLPKDSFVAVQDPSLHGLPDPDSGYFYYQRVGRDHYYLRSIGPDGEPFTADDIVPGISANRTGLLIEAPTKPATAQ